MTDDYLQWIYNRVIVDEIYKGRSYRQLFTCLYFMQFRPINPMDENRAQDGINLRYRFADAFGLPYPEAAANLDTHPCSILEMMAALAFRCEDQIMEDDSYGDRASWWFFKMLDSLGLTDMDDCNFDRDKVDFVINRFNALEYANDGMGGLFYLPGTNLVMPSIDIWYQMMAYLKTLD